MRIFRTVLCPLRDSSLVFFSKEIYRLKFLVKHLYHFCSSLIGSVSCGARRASVQIPAFKSRSLTER